MPSIEYMKISSINKNPKLTIVGPAPSIVLNMICKRLNRFTNRKTLSMRIERRIEVARPIVLALRLSAIKVAKVRITTDKSKRFQLSLK